MLIISKQGTAQMLSAYVGQIPGLGDLTLRLYTNDANLTLAQDLSAFTEATFAGYGGRALSFESWTVVQGAPSIATFQQQPFICTQAQDDQSAQEVYGYYLTRAGSDNFWWAERFPGPYRIQRAGDAIRITPRITLI